MASKINKTTATSTVSSIRWRVQNSGIPEELLTTAEAAEPLIHHQ